ncbi:MAG: 16S rRNA (cytosine(967)-C(5))-methyltransferase RsmB [Geobacter sp.]|nr:16S rRNA (cytosine(967)-C(5))-methyltransferase RsmB [Geobacter sp.]
MPSSDPRRTAYDILLRVEGERLFADVLLDKALTRGELQGPDRGLLTELVYGVLRRQGTLDHVIGQFSSRPAKKLDPQVRMLLRLGIYQLLYLDRVPTFAAVNETVQLAKEVAPHAAGFINAILRRTDRERDAIAWPDPKLDPAGYIAAVHSHPRWLVESWIEQLGYEEAERLARAMSEPPPLTLRVNTLRIDRAGLLGLFAEHGISAEATRFASHGVTVTPSRPIAELPGFAEGLFTVQDESSQLAVCLLAPCPGETILDLCAAPGGKSTYLAQLMENHGTVLACDISANKLPRIRETADRLGLSCITTQALDAAKVPPAGHFDRILVDAPCSALGVLRRNPEGKWRVTPADVANLAASQKRILRNASQAVKPGGFLLYSTCSTSLAEDEEIVDDFLSENSGFVLENGRELHPEWGDLFTERGMLRSWPHRHGMDGFFAALLKKR